MSFSSSIRITDIDDFITPAQECIKPVKIRKDTVRTSKIIIGSDGSYTGITEMGEKYQMEKAEITLNDCLACSGCVTSAETVLINEQSTDEFFKKIAAVRENNENSLIVISISPQSEASLSQRFNLGNPLETRQKLQQFFHSIFTNVVLLSTTFGREFSLMETAKIIKEHIESSGIHADPIITSSCPGWVCYAEKHKSNQILVPLISRVKSPQQMMGYLVKHYLPDLNEKYRSIPIFHATVMPCFDKKLEASRDEFSFYPNDSQEKQRDVDIVLSTAEIESIILDRAYDFQAAHLVTDCFSDVEEMFSCKDSMGKHIIYNHEGTGSGGYLELAMRYCAKELHNIDLGTVLSEDKRVHFKQLRNSDFQEVTLISDRNGSSDVLLRFAYVYGFRNIQTIIQKIRKKKCEYQFIEVMACPGGCLNGGGQIRTEGGKEEQTNLIENVKNKYHSVIKQQPLVNENVRAIYKQITDLSILTATFNIVPKLDIINPASFKW